LEAASGGDGRSTSLEEGGLSHRESSARATA
jgi:hypothetical protein